MAWSPCSGAAWRVLEHYYWTKMRASKGARAIKSDRGEVLEVLSTAAHDARIKVVAKASGRVQLTTDAGISLAHPGDGGVVDVDIPGMRHLSWHDGKRNLTFDIPLFGKLDHALCAVRTLASLVTFPFRHLIDFRDYFLRGDNAAGDRIERALLSPLIQPERPPSPPKAFSAGPPGPVPRRPCFRLRSSFRFTTPTTFFRSVLIG